MPAPSNDDIISDEKAIRMHLKEIRDLLKQILAKMLRFDDRDDPVAMEAIREGK